MDDDGERDRMLARIAATLGLEERDFRAGQAFDDTEELGELLHLWEGITDRQGRARVLSLARQEYLRCRCSGPL